MIDLDRQFIFKLNTSSLPMKEKGSGVFVFRCPLCGDSKKSKHKARGHLIPNRELNIYWYTCHNCFTNIPFGKFLHRIDASLYAMYRKDAFVYKHGKPRQESKPDIEGQKFFEQLVPVSTLASTHPAKKYCNHRKISESYFTPKFKSWAEQFAPEKVLKLEDEILFITFPLRTRYKFLGFQSRLISEKGPRYVTISLGDSPLAYGLDTLDANIPFYITEGIIDCLHLPNSIATLNGNLSNSIKKLGLPDNGIHCLDNERFNEHIAKEYQKTIKKGHKIFIWPNTVQAKDFNELAVKYNQSNEQIKTLVDQNTHSGMSAELAFSQWRNG